MLLTVPAIAQVTYEIKPGCTSDGHFDVLKIVPNGNYLNTSTLDHKTYLSEIISVIKTDAGSNSFKLVFSGTLNFSGQNLTEISPTLTTINGELIVGNVNVGSVTVNGTLNANDLTIPSNETLTVGNYKVLKVNGNYTNSGTEDFAANSIIIGVSRNYPLPLNLTNAKWNFVGFPESTNLSFLTGNDMPEDIWAIKFDYSTNAWNTTQYLLANSNVSRGQGILIFPDGAVSTNLTFNTNNAGITMSYPGSSSTSEKWFALANPFTYNLAIEKFLAKNHVQGERIYVYDGTTFILKTLGMIEPLQAFFVDINPSYTNVVVFNLEDLFYKSQVAKSETSTKNNIVLDVITDDYAVPVTFLHNEAALVEYDIFDANKMFGSGEVAEPYFVLGERNLCIESVNTLPYTATMNIKSGETRNVQIVASDIPEQYQVILKDGEQEIALEQGSVYETQISSGENAERFKVIVNLKNNVSISDVEALEEISVRNLNRNIIIEGGKNIHTEIFNVLGQKVYETSSRNFMLDKANAGAYVVKVKDGNAVNTTKIIIK